MGSHYYLTAREGVVSHPRGSCPSWFWGLSLWIQLRPRRHQHPRRRHGFHGDICSSRRLCCWEKWHGTIFKIKSMEKQNKASSQKGVLGKRGPGGTASQPVGMHHGFFHRIVQKLFYRIRGKRAKCYSQQFDRSFLIRISCKYLKCFVFWHLHLHAFLTLLVCINSITCIHY